MLASLLGLDREGARPSIKLIPVVCITAVCVAMRQTQQCAVYTVRSAAGSDTELVASQPGSCSVRRIVSVTAECSCKQALSVDRLRRQRSDGDKLLASSEDDDCFLRFSRLSADLVDNDVCTRPWHRWVDHAFLLARRMPIPRGPRDQGASRSFRLRPFRSKYYFIFWEQMTTYGVK